MSKLIFFDMDGVLVNTESLIRLAYSETGVHMPHGTFGLTWREWLIGHKGINEEEAKKLHDRKNEIYLGYMLNRHIVESCVLPPARVMKKLMDNGNAVSVLTGASSEATSAIMSMLFGENVVYTCELSIKAKATIMKAAAQTFDEVVYVDDNKWHIRYVHDHCPNVNAITYVNQTEEELWKLLS